MMPNCLGRFDVNSLISYCSKTAYSSIALALEGFPSYTLLTAPVADILDADTLYQSRRKLGTEVRLSQIGEPDLV